MKIAFIYDHKFFSVGTKVFSEVGFHSSFWDRYLEYRNDLVVIGRNGRTTGDTITSNMIRSDHPKVEFVLLPNLSSIKGQLFEKTKIKKILQDIYCKSDLVIIRLPSEIGLLALELDDSKTKKTIVEVVGCPFDSLWNYGTFVAKIYAPVLSYRTKSTLYNQKYVIYVTEEFLQKRYPANKKAVAISCSDVDIESMSEETLIKRIDRNYNENRKIQIGLIGSLRTKVKGIQTVLDALVLIKEEIANVEFHVLGSGPKEKWQSQIDKKGLRGVAFLDGGLPPGNPVLQWLDEIDIYLQPSFTEGLPRALIEAMSRGCPAIGSTAGGIPELLEPDCLIKPGYKEGLSKLLLKAIKDVEWRNSQSRKNYLKAQASYSKNLLKKKRNDFVDSVLRSI